ncbi:dixin-like isoform X1 [Clupea harengus]|uniref:Dixin-like isoform X1 n=1 Tax=Clupea harengus TaxID=7950 RepID=A0A6P8FV71_CLUHA|nr:dixin-like isoform X1 [Clupea harengus]
MIASLSKGNLLDVLQEGFSEPQVATYVSWVNAQLRKKPGVNPVHDLRQDLRDGVVLAHLIEIVAGELLDGIHYAPLDNQEKRQNVERVLQFMSSKRIRMPQTSARDIVDGNLKSAMRLILALAAHFKPSASASHRAGASMGRGAVGSSPNHRPHSTMAMAQNAVAALAVARQDASRSGRCLLHLRQEWNSQGNLVAKEIDNPCWSVRALVQQYEGQKDEPDEDSDTKSPSLRSSSPTQSPGVTEDKKEGVKSQAVEAVKSDDMVKLTPCVEGAGSRPDGSLGVSIWEDQLCEQQELLEKEMQDARRMVSSLQALLLHGSLPEDEQDVSLGFAEGVDNAEQQLVVIRSRLDQSMEETQDLKRELSKFRQEARNLLGVKDALQQRMAVQETSVLQLKQELLRANMARDELTGQNVEMQRKVEERNRLLSDYKKELSQKDRLLQQQQTKLDEALRKLAESCHQKTSLQRELERKERMLQELMNNHTPEEVPVAHNNGYSGSSMPQTYRGAEELQLVHDALRSLRNSFSGHDPQQHTLDTLEQGVASLADRLHAMETCRRPERKVRGKSPGRKATPTDPESWPSGSSKNSLAFGLHHTNTG